MQNNSKRKVPAWKIQFLTSGKNNQRLSCSAGERYLQSTRNEKYPKPQRKQQETTQWAYIGTEEYDFGAAHRGKNIIFWGGDDPAVHSTGGTVLLVLAYQCQTDMDGLEKCVNRKERTGENNFFNICRKGYVLYMAQQ